ncbi:hypothetical protein D3C83_127560 [compost metagenome]
MLTRSTRRSWRMYSTAASMSCQSDSIVVMACAYEGLHGAAVNPAWRSGARLQGSIIAAGRVERP